LPNNLLPAQSPFCLPTRRQTKKRQGEERCAYCLSWSTILKRCFHSIRLNLFPLFSLGLKRKLLFSFSRKAKTSENLCTFCEISVFVKVFAKIFVTFRELFRKNRKNFFRNFLENTKVKFFVSNFLFSYASFANGSPIHQRTMNRFPFLTNMLNVYAHNEGFAPPRILISHPVRCICIVRSLLHFTYTVVSSKL
jgi:hypothetical protein